SYMSRSASLDRQTSETNIHVSIQLDGTGQADIKTGIGFFDHMITALAKHSLMDLTIRAQGDLHIDPHHTVEDVGITIGKALYQALGDKKGIRRFGNSTVPMDEALASVVVDFSGRTYLVWNANIPRSRLGDFDTELTEDFWQAFASQAQCNLHVQLHYGRNTHHLIEAIFKAAAQAIRQAIELDSRATGSIPSTKGTLSK
ncbi:MAG TPA: imidazoleglycerol-phosphate dehydratase HisB, partial [Gemmatales bacterium]|nr:imidazoleglycerol-phosphate dehydratase HisB [Gemmatales bacterium]